MVIKESNLKFEFGEEFHVIKFDDSNFYRKPFNHLPGAKGVDIIADSKDLIQMIEIKNCLGYEKENIWRTSVDNSKVHKASSDLDVNDRDSLDIEVAKKVAMTISCLTGAWTKCERMENAQVLAEFWRGMTDRKIPTDKKKIRVILFLEGDFDREGPKSRGKKAIMSRIQGSLKTKLSWLNCQVSVVDSNTYKNQCFRVRKS